MINPYDAYDEAVKEANEKYQETIELELQKILETGDKS